MRRRHESEGKWEPSRNDIEDGYDTIEWAAKQSWSIGKVGMEGGSYLGHVQWRASMSAPPHLVTIFPMVASTSHDVKFFRHEGRVSEMQSIEFARNCN